MALTEDFDKEQLDEVWERCEIRAEQRNNVIEGVYIHKRVCLMCLQIRTFVVTHEMDTEGGISSHKYCIEGKHDTEKPGVFYKGI